jgi:hypothetical protein
LADEERLRLLYEQEQRHIAEQLRLEEEREQKRIDTCIAAKEGLSMITEDAMSKSLRDWHAVANEAIEMHAEDELSELLRVDLKEYDAMIAQKRRIEREAAELLEINRDAIQAAFGNRRQEFKSVWNAADANKNTMKAKASTNRGSFSDSWGGSLGNASNATKASNTGNVSLSSASPTTNNGSMLAQVSERMTGELCQPLSLLQDSWGKLIQEAKERSLQPVKVVTMALSASESDALRLIATSNNTEMVTTPVNKDPIVKSLEDWIAWVLFVSLEMKMAPVNCADSNFNVPEAASAFQLTDKAIEILHDLGLGEQDSGKVTTLKLSVEGLGSIDFINSAAFPNLKEIEINVNKLKNLHGLRNLRRLEQLSAKDNLIEDVECLAQCGALRTVKLDCNHIVSLDGMVGGSSSSSFPNLMSLSANTNYITSFPQFAHCPQLQKLELYHNFIRYARFFLGLFIRFVYLVYIICLASFHRWPCRGCLH